MIEAEGYAGHLRAPRACAAAARAGLSAMGFELFADPAHASDTVTAAWLPDGVEWADAQPGDARAELVLAGGQGKLAGRILRIGHLGAVDAEDDIVRAIAIVEEGAVASTGPCRSRRAPAAAARRAPSTAEAAPSPA